MTCIQVLASKLSTIAKFQNLNSRPFQGFSSTFKHLICFQALSRALKFLFQIQAFSRISQACYEPCKMHNSMECHYLDKLFEHSRLNHTSFIQTSSHLIKVNHRPVQEVTATPNSYLPSTWWPKETRGSFWELVFYSLTD